MGKELKDYLHFYIGGTFLTVDDKKISLSFWWCEKILMGETKARLLLRKLQSITEEEEKFLEKQFDMTIQNEHGFYTSDGLSAENFIPKNAEIFKYLLNQRFDIFNLIEAGLAVEE